MEKLNLDFVPASFEQWQNIAIESLIGKNFNKLISPTYEGIDLQPIYFPDAISSWQNNDLPGFFPFLRSNYLGGYKFHLWHSCVEYDQHTADSLNDSLRCDLSNGTRGAIIKSARFNEYGTIFNSDIDFSNILKGIDSSNLLLLIDTDAPFRMFELAKNFGIGKLKGGLLFDPFVFSILNGRCLDYDSFFSRLNAECYLPNAEFSPLSINSAFLYNCGANSVLEIAYSLAAFTHYASSMLDKGASIDDIIRNSKFNIAIGPDFFMQIAKVRALRACLAHVIDAFGGNSASQSIFIHAETCSWNKSRQDVYNNILRNTTEAIAGILGGVDSLNVKFFDSAYGSPTEFSRRITRNTMNVLQFECNLMDTIDPAAGSAFLEKITEELINLSWSKFQAFETMGGAVEIINKSLLQAEIAENANKRMSDMASRRKILIGVNKYPNPKDIVPTTIHNDFDSIASQINYDLNQTTSFLSETTCAGLQAFKPWENFERLAIKTKSIQSKIGYTPIIHLINFGNTRDYKARADFANDFFKVAAFEIVQSPGYTDIAPAVEFAIAQNANVIVICSSDELYQSYCEPFARSLKSLNKNLTIILAGYPADKIDDYRNSGVDSFIHIKSNLINTIEELQSTAWSHE